MDEEFDYWTHQDSLMDELNAGAFEYLLLNPGGLRKLAVNAGMSEGNLHRCIRNNKIQAGNLEAISRLLGVDILFSLPRPQSQ